MAGTITDIDLMYDLNAPSEEWVRVSMPSNIPIGVRGVVYVVGRNDMATAQEMGVRWAIRDPSGIIVSEDTQWIGFKISAGGSVSFGVDEITFNREGTWELEADLLMNLAAPVVADTYRGNLCTVFEGVVPPEAEALLLPLALVLGVGGALGIGAALLAFTAKKE